MLTFIFISLILFHKCHDVNLNDGDETKKNCSFSTLSPKSVGVFTMIINTFFFHDLYLLFKIENSVRALPKMIPLYTVCNEKEIDNPVV